MDNLTKMMDNILILIIRQGLFLKRSRERK